MRSRLLVVVASVASSAGAAALVGSIATAGPAPETVTLGSAVGSPTANICLSEVDCTYLPFNGVSNPALQVPFEGTVTSFSVNADSASGVVELRVLRPAGGGRYTGAGTSPAEKLGVGLNIFAISLPVRAGDLLGLDNSSSALLFEPGSATAITAYYEPHLADGSTAAANNNRSDYRLLLSATVQSSSTQLTTTTTQTGTTGPAGVPPARTPPVVSDVTQSHGTWVEGRRLVRTSSRVRRSRKAPVGTAFGFALNEPATVSFGFTQRLNGHRVGRRCVASSDQIASHTRCQRTATRGAFSFAGHGGANKVIFQGRISRAKTLKPGRYTLVIVATNTAGQSSMPKKLSFTIIK